MGSTWRYVENARGHALETVFNLGEYRLGQLVAWLRSNDNHARYAAFRKVEDDAIRWMSAAPSQRRTRFKTDSEGVVIIAAGMWYAKIAYQMIEKLHEGGWVQGGPGYRKTTAAAAQLACEMFDTFGIRADKLTRVIPNGSGYDEWDTMDESLIESLRPYTYELGFVHGDIDLD